MADETPVDPEDAAPALEGSATAAAPAGADKAQEGVESASDDQAPAPDTTEATAPEGEPAADSPEQSSEAAEPEPEPEPEPAREVDPVRDPLLAQLQGTPGVEVLDSEVSRGDIWVRVSTSSWKAAVTACRDQLGMDYFCFLSGLDWLPNPGLSAEKVWDPDETVPALETPDAYATGVAGGDSRFQVFARLFSTKAKVGITLKADVDGDDPRIDTISDVYPGADWHERETWEMYGFDFAGHPSLRHMYLPGEFEGHPLRKDFPLLARELKPWPGLVDLEPMPGEPDAEADATAEGGE